MSDQNLQYLMKESRLRESDKTKLNAEYHYYRPSEVIKGLFKNTFDLRFEEIKNSLVDMGLLRTMYHLIRWRCNYTSQAVPKDQEELQRLLPMQKPTFNHSKQNITYTWIGHSTAVISFGGRVNFMIDPVFSDRSSPYQWIGPKRFRDPACQIMDLPKIDCVLVSHDHYDHLDQHSLKQLYRRYPPTQFVAGLGSRSVFPKRCHFTELDWTEKKQFQFGTDKFQITFVPVCHWSRRGIMDKNTRLWGGFVIQEKSTGRKVFYSGDTGYCGVFQEIGQFFGGFDLAILPIGAYLPREYLKNQHVNPEQAVRVHRELKAKKSVGVHWGTFPLGYEHYASGREDLKIAARQAGLKEDEFVAISHGASLVI